MFTDQVAHQARRPPLSGGREVVEEGEALEEGEVSGIGQEFQLHQRLGNTQSREVGSWVLGWSLEGMLILWATRSQLPASLN